MNTLSHRFLPLLGVFLLVACSSDVTPPAGSVTVGAVNPSSGPLAGGTSVTITGTNFIDVTSATIGGTALANRSVVSGTEITGTTASSANSGARDVVVTSSSRGSATCTGCFTYVSSSVIAATVAAGAYHACGVTTAGAVYC